MKKTLLIILLLLNNNVWSQNIIPNPGFEINSLYPDGPGEYNYATGWNNCNGGGSPDYFSTLGSGLVQLPDCFIGTLNPHSGDGCMGAAFYYDVDFREYIDIQMTSPMTIGTTYNVSFYISNGVTNEEYVGGGVNQVSAAFSTNELTQISSGPIPFSPQFTYDSILYSYTWKLISFQFTADSAYNYFTLGNFKDDASTQYQQFDGDAVGAYYFFDDISVQPTSGAPPVAEFLSNDTTICAETCISFNNLSTGATSWKWLFAGANPSSDTAANPQNICYLNSGNFDVTLVAINNTGRDTLQLTNYISVYAAPPSPVIAQSNDTLFCNTDSSYTSYQWFNDSALISGATDTFLVITSSGNYNVQVSNKNNCKIAGGINITLGIENLAANNFISLIPNPVTDELLVTGNWSEGLRTPSEKPETGNLKLDIINMLGEIIYTEELSSKSKTVNCKSFPSGIYFVQLTSENERWVGRFVKQ